MRTQLTLSCVVLGGAVLALLGPAGALADTLYVDCNRSCPTAPDCDGTESAPLNQIQLAIDAAAAGDTVLVLPGTCDESLTIDKLIHLKGRDGPNATRVIPTAIPAPDVLTVTAVTGPEDPVEISGITFMGGSSGIKVGTNARVYVHNAVAAQNTQDGLFALGQGFTVLVVNSVFDRNGRHGLYAYGQSGGLETLSVYNSIVSDNTSSGLNWNSYVTTLQCNNLFHNNSDTRTPTCGSTNAAPCFVDPINGNFHLRLDPECTSAAIDGGRAVLTDRDPDGSRNNQGAFGGPGSVDFWPDPPGGPVVTDLTVSPSSVPQGGTVTITVTGEIR